MTSGPLSIGVAQLAAELPADLVLLGCHGSSTEDHSSLTELLLGRCTCPILTVHEGGGHACTLHLGEGRQRPLRVLVPTDFSPAGAAAARYACGLAERLGGEVHLLHVLEESGSPVGNLFSMTPVGPSDFSRKPETSAEGRALAAARERLAELIPGRMADRAYRHVEPGRAEDAILGLAREIVPDLIVMGEHAREPLRRFFTHDTARGILHQAACPVWFVPPPRLAA
jgi:nucleotide-binding universal stress UspA family protein